MRRFFCDRCADEIKDTTKMVNNYQIPVWLGLGDNVTYNICGRCWTEFIADLKKWFDARVKK